MAAGAAQLRVPMKPSHPTVAVLNLYRMGRFLERVLQWPLNASRSARLLDKSHSGESGPESPRADAEISASPAGSHWSEACSAGGNEDRRGSSTPAQRDPARSHRASGDAAWLCRTSVP